MNSITGAVAPSYVVDGKGNKMDPMLEVLVLLYIGGGEQDYKKGDRVCW